MSHEIRSPLNVILSFVGLLKEDLAETATEDMMYSFESIDSASARIIRTIDLILNMTDLQIGSYESSTKEINVVEILQNIRLEYKQFAERRGLDLRLNLKFNRKKITSDEYALTQIISNLVDNAIKYSDEGYIEIFAEKGKNRDLIVKIIDTGIGMSEEFLPNIFNSFTQEEQGYTRSYDGNGLGMALVKKYCDIINAEITVKSKKGKGSTFTIIIPNLKR
jgi:signal transduction histidine kinase